MGKIFFFKQRIEDCIMMRTVWYGMAWYGMVWYGMAR